MSEAPAVLPNRTHGPLRTAGSPSAAVGAGAGSFLRDVPTAGDETAAADTVTCLCPYLAPGGPTVLCPLRQDALLEAGGRAADLRGSGGVLGGRGRLCVGGSGWGDVLHLMQARGPADLPAVGSLVAGLRWDVGGLGPRAGVLGWRGFPHTFGWFHPRPRPVLFPGGRKMHQNHFRLMNKRKATFKEI